MNEKTKWVLVIIGAVIVGSLLSIIAEPQEEILFAVDEEGNVIITSLESNVEVDGMLLSNSVTIAKEYYELDSEDKNHWVFTIKKGEVFDSPCQVFFVGGSFYSNSSLEEGSKACELWKNKIIGLEEQAGLEFTGIASDLNALKISNGNDENLFAESRFYLNINSTKMVTPRFKVWELENNLFATNAIILRSDGSLVDNYGVFIPKNMVEKPKYFYDGFEFMGSNCFVTLQDLNLGVVEK